MHTTMPMVYGSYTLELYITAILLLYHDHSVRSRQTVVFLVYTTGGTFDFEL